MSQYLYSFWNDKDRLFRQRKENTRNVDTAKLGITVSYCPPIMNPLRFPRGFSTKENVIDTFERSTPIISYADTTIGAVFFNLAPTAKEIASEDMRTLISLAKERRISSVAREQYALSLGRYLELYHHTLLAHEWCHILQAITYPFLYFRCVQDFYISNSILTSLRQETKPVISLPLSLPDDWLATLRAPTRSYRVSIDEQGQCDIRLADPQDRRANDLTENDLLEEDASIFQYKVEIGALGTGTGYKRWNRESQRRRYTMAFNFLSRLLGVDNAYLALPALVRVAFSTTVPLQVFAELAGLTLFIDADLPTLLGIDEYFEFLLDRLCANPYLKRDVPNINEPRSADSDAVAYLDRTAHHTIIETSSTSKKHPLFPLAHALWQECGENPLLPTWLFHPYTVFDRLRDDVSPQFKAYWPPMFIIRLLHPELPLNNGVCPWLEQKVGIVT